LIVGTQVVEERAEEVCLTTHVRCPACHLRMETAPPLQADQAELSWRKAQTKAGAAFVNWPHPEDDTRSFPCRRCATPIQRGKLVEGVYDERIPRWLYLELPAIAIAVGGLIGWALDAGFVLSAVAGVLAMAASARALFQLHHGVIENRRLRERQLEPMPLGIRSLALRASVLLAAAVFYRALGWSAVIAAAVAIVVASVSIEARADRRRREGSRSAIAEHNRREVERVSRR
jgi:hypothetical protein